MVERKATSNMVKHFREVKLELKKVSWPTRREITTSTVVVLVTVLVIALYIGGLDYLFTVIVKLVTFRL